MYMHATRADGILHKALIRKNCFVAQCRREAGLSGIFA
jgi:hypothetical protein